MAEQLAKLTALVKTTSFDPAAELAKFNQQHSDGAVASFSGWVRGSDHEGKPIEKLRIEHYPSMTEKALLKIGEQAMAKFQLSASLIIHRSGELKVLDPIVLVVTAASHRGGAFDGCQMIMDFLKTEVPFWKQEIGQDGAKWVESRTSDVESAKNWQN